MSFDLFGFNKFNNYLPFLGAPSGVFGYALIGLYALVGLLALAFTLPSFAKLSPRRWWAFGSLLLLSIPLAQLFILRFPANILSPPDIPVEPQRPGLALFALVPAFVAGGWLGVGPAMVVGLATGLSRAAWETFSLATPFEFALVAGVVAWCMRQGYRGWPAAILRHPMAAGLLAGLTLWPVLLFSYLAYSETTGLPGWDYVASLVGAAAPVFIAQAALAGVFAEVARQGLPAWWPQRRGTVPPPYVASLNRKLLFTLIPLFILGIAVLFWADITIATRVSTVLILDEMERAAHNAGRGIPFFVQTGRGLLQDMAAQEGLLGEDSQTQTERLSQYLGSVPYFRQLTLYSPDLTPLAVHPASGQIAATLTDEELQLLQLALDGIPLDTTVYPPNQDDPVDVVFAVPVLEAGQGAPVGVLLGRADLSSNPLMQAVTDNLEGLAGGAGQGFIVDDRNTIIYHAEVEQRLQPFVPESSARPLTTDLERALAYEDKAPNGTRRLVLYYPVPDHAWSVVITVPNEVVLSLAAQISTPIIVILLLIGLIGLILVSLIAGRVTRPAEALALAAERISEGRLDQPVVVEGEDEIGRAGLAFERMRQKLRARLEELGMLLRVSQGVAGSLNLDDALPPIVQGALNASGAAGVRIVLLPHEDVTAPEGAPKYQVYADGAAATLMEPLDRGVLQLTRLEGRAAIENLARARAVLDVAPVTGILHALLALPLRQENTYFGAMWLGYDQPHTFTETETNFAATLAGQAAVAVANARLFEAAEQGRQRLAAILASTPDAVIVTDPNERLLLLNPAAEAAFGLTGKPVTGRPVAQVLPNPELVKLLKDSRAGGAPLGVGEFQAPTGRTLYASASTIIGADGSILGRVCVLRDVTHFKELDVMKSEFVATVSHDLRAPLTFMRGYATMLPMVGPLNEKQREFGDRIMIGIEQMTELIDDVLNLAGMEAGMDLTREPCQMSEIVHEVVEALSTYAVNKGLRLLVDVPPDLRSVSGDPSLLRRAIANLVENAIKYTPAGGEVRVRASTDDTRFLFAVTDNGLGIAPADQARLFQKFFRVRQHGSTQVKGSGLGLAIVKSTVERHEGRVWVESKLGKGSTFHFEIPQRRAM